MTGTTRRSHAGASAAVNETVKAHVSHILARLDERDCTQAVIAACQAGLIQSG
jgi:DNA-binding NarL/FixJ family response regulator